MKKLIIFGNSDFAQLVTYYLEKQYDIVAYCVDNEYIFNHTYVDDNGDLRCKDCGELLMSEFMEY